MFDGVGWGEILVLLMIGLFVFGPDKLPRAARDAGRLLRQLRSMATGVRNDLRSELGPELADLDLRTLHPKTFVRKHLFEDDDDPLFRAPYGGGRGQLERTLFDDLGESPFSKNDRPSLSKGGLAGNGTAKSTTSTSKAAPAGQPVPAAKTVSTSKPAPKGAAGKASAFKASTAGVGSGTVPGQPPAAGPAAPYDLDAT